MTLAQIQRHPRATVLGFYGLVTGCGLVGALVAGIAARRCGR